MSEAESANNGVYFLSLKLENVRCFGSEQTLNLSDSRDKNRPAQWTVILGDNGTGKTTLLEVLLKHNRMHFGDQTCLLPRNNADTPKIQYSYAYNNSLKNIEGEFLKYDNGYEIKKSMSGMSLPFEPYLFIYGASRKPSREKLKSNYLF